MNNRVIFSDDGTLQDFSVALNNYQAGVKDFEYVTGDDYFYIGARLPFNHFYAKFARASELTDSEMTVEYWDGNVWVPVVELIDETLGFSQDGFVTFVPNKDKQWMQESTNYSGEEVDGLETLTIYDRYWIRISFDQSFDGGPEMDNQDPPQPTGERLPCQASWVGNLFSNDSDLAVEYQELTRTSLMSAWKSGTTSWEEIHVKAAEVIIDDLIDMGVIIEKGQILDRSDFKLASVAKVAQLIFTQIGDDYVDDLKAAAGEYKSRIGKRRPKIDKNANAIEDGSESFAEQGFFKR